MNLPRILWFLVVFCGLTAATHRYIWRRVFRDTGLGAIARRRGAILVTALGLLLVGGTIGSRTLPQPWSAVLAWPAYIWMGVVILLCPLLAVTGLGGWVALRLRGERGPDLPDPARRLALQRGTAALASLGALGAAGAGLDSALTGPRLRELTVPVPRLPAPFKGLRVAQISDLHVGPTIGRAFVADIVRRVNALKPDLVAITGDLVDGSVDELRDSVAPLTELRSTFGTFFVTGNHEYYSGADAWCAHLGEMGIRVLRNERHTLERDGAALDVVGTEDWLARGEHVYDLETAVKDRDADRPALLLSHQPRCIEGAAAHGLDFVLCGHTHGGQIWPFGTLVVALTQPYVRGLHRHTERTTIYVHPGTGWWGPPMRVNMPSEIALFTLT